MYSSSSAVREYWRQPDMSGILMQTESANVPAQVQADLPIHSRPVRVYKSPHIGGSPHNSIHYISASEEVTTAPTTNRPPPPRHFPEPYFDKLAFTSGKDISSRLHPTESRNPLSPHTPRRFAPTMTNPPQFPMPWAHSRVHGQYRTTPLATGSLLNARPAYRDLGRLGTNHGTVFNRTTQTPEIDGGPAYRDLGRLGGSNAPQLKAPEQTLEIDGGPAYRDLGRLEGNNAAALEEPERSPEIDIRDPVFDSSSSDVEGGNGSPVVQEETRALEVPNLTEVDNIDVERQKKMVYYIANMDQVLRNNLDFIQRISRSSAVGTAVEVFLDGYAIIRANFEADCMASRPDVVVGEQPASNKRKLPMAEAVQEPPAKRLVKAVVIDITVDESD